MIDFLPGDINLAGCFRNTFDKFEGELTALVIVAALEANGNAWRTIYGYELSERFKRLTAGPGFWRDLFNNPVARIDMQYLADKGFAEWEENGSAIRFTEAGIERMRKWKKREQP